MCLTAYRRRVVVVKECLISKGYNFENLPDCKYVHFFVIKVNKWPGIFINPQIILEIPKEEILLYVITKWSPLNKTKITIWIFCYEFGISEV